MKFADFNEIVNRFAKTNVMPSLKTAQSRFLMGMALGAGVLKAETMIPQLDTLHVVTYDEDGKPDGIDTKRLGDALMGGFDASPEFVFDKFGLKLNFTKDDAKAFLKELGVAA
ncbi:MAG: hypothetical protein IJ658_14070 [Kiritimatiellae bacterium]|nr:hypothetical protein [Kiritimatiellia bacterium]